MIISGGSRSNWRFFGKHLTNEKDNGYVRVAEMRGLIADSVPEALREMDAIASGTRCKNSFYHANINPRPGEHLTPDQWTEAVDRLEHNLGLTGHARFVVEHEKEGRVHQHVIWSRTDPDTMKVVSDSFTARLHEQTSRELEAAFGLEPVESVLVADREHERPDRRPKHWETFRGYKSGITPDQVREEVTALWNAADTGPAFASALDESDYILCKGDRRDFCIIDAAGNEHSLARRIDGQNAAQVRTRMADVDRDALPSVAEGRDLAGARQEALADLVDEPEVAQQPPDAEPGHAAPAEQVAADTAPLTHEPQPAGFWETAAGYVARVFSNLRSEPARSAWSVEACRDLLCSDEPPTAAVHSIDEYAAPLAEAILERGAIPTRDGQTWWDRAGYALSNAVDQAATWAKARWSSFTERLDHERHTQTNEPDMEI